MSHRLKIYWKLTSGFLRVLVAVITIVLFIIEYVDTKNEVRTIKAQLEAFKEKNQQLIFLLVAAASHGKATYSDLTQYLSESEAQDIAGKAGLNIKANFPFDLETQFYPSG